MTTRIRYDRGIRRAMLATDLTQRMYYDELFVRSAGCTPHTRLVAMLGKYGGETTCRRLLACPETIERGVGPFYEWCFNNNQLSWFYEYSVEGYIVSVRFRRLFTRSERAEAQRRLELYYRPPSGPVNAPSRDPLPGSSGHTAYAHADNHR